MEVKVKGESYKSHELRISLTSECNYACIFCHNEGIDKKSKISQRITDSKFQGTLNLIGKLINEKGYTDVTLTGGEPLLKKPDLYKIIDFIKVNGKILPDITIVTNGYLIDEEFADKIKTYEKLKVNVSLHSFDNAIYLDITRPKKNKINLDEIIKNIKMLIAKNIKTKINYVLLKGRNISQEQMLEAIEKSKDMGVYGIKFIELLVTDANERLLPEYYDVKSINNLKDKVAYIGDDGRKAEYKLINDLTDFKIETVKCACRNGCSNCLKYRALMLDVFSNYYPCFMDSDGLIMDEDNYNVRLEEGKKRIIDLAKQYGNKAPILNNEPTFEKSRKEVYFEIDDPKYTEFSAMYKEAKIMRTRYFEQSYFIYMPRTADSEWNNFERTLKIREDRNSGEAILSISNIEVEENVFLINKTTFPKSDRFLHKGKGDEIRELLSNMDFIEVFHYDMQGFYYRDPHGLKFSIAKIGFSNQVNKNIVCFFPELSDIEGIREFATKYSLKPINKNFFTWAKDTAKN